MTPKVIELSDESLIPAARKLAASRAREAGLGALPRTRLVTAVSEIARNAVLYGGTGRFSVEIIERGPRRGVKVVVSDQGPGISDLEQALEPGFTTGKGMGLGLSGARKLCNEFEIQTAPGKGTVVTLVQWNR